jgi:hypothetical protein
MKKCFGNKTGEEIVELNYMKTGVILKAVQVHFFVERGDLSGKITKYLKDHNTIKSNATKSSSHRKKSTL